MFSGVIVPMITPFEEDLSLDLDAARWLARWLADSQVSGIFPYSTTGEFVHLKEEEGLRLVEAVLDEVGGRVKVIPGISSNDTERAIELGRKMKDLGVDGVIATPPFFFKLKEDHLYLHFSRIAERVDLPLIVYNIPSLTGNMVPVNVYRRLVSEHSGVVGAKVTYDSVAYMRNLILEVKSIRKDFSVLTGLDDHLLNVLAMGGDGGIMACANFAPEIHVGIYRAFMEGDLERAVELHRRLMKVVRVYDVASSFPTAIKTALSLMGTPIKPYVRPPLIEEPEEVVESIRRILHSAEVA